MGETGDLVKEQLEDLKKEVHSLHEENNKLRRELDKTTKEKKHLGDKLKETTEEKQHIEDKIKAYLTLSDILQEYKTELNQLRIEHKALQDRLKQSESMESRPAKSESRISDVDHRLTNGLDQEQRNNNTQESQKSLERLAIADEILRSNSDFPPVRTQELFGANENEHRQRVVYGSQNASKGGEKQSEISRLKDSFPCQESMPPESEQAYRSGSTSITGLGFHVLSDKDFGSDITKRKGTVDDEDIEKALQSLKQIDRTPDMKSAIATFQSCSDQLSIYKKANSVLIEKHNISAKRIKELESFQDKLQLSFRRLEEDNARLLDRIRCFEQEKHASSELAQSGLSGAQNGWVHVQAKATFDKSQKTSVSDLEGRNAQLLEANQRWSTEWNRLKGSLEDKIRDLERDRDRLEREKTDLALAEDAKVRDYEKMLMNAKKMREEEENAKEEALSQLQSANHRVDTLQSQVTDLQDQVSRLTREKQTLLSRPQPVVTSPHDSGVTHHYDTEIVVLRQQILLFQEDFERERQDRAKAQQLIHEYKAKNDNLKKRVRHVDEKYARLEMESQETKRKLQNENEKLQREIKSLQELVRRAQTQQVQRDLQRDLYAQQVRAGPQPQQYVPQPQQFVVLPQAYGGRTRVGEGFGYPSPSAMSPQYNRTYVMPQTEHLQGAWSCKQCTYINCPERTVCEVCGYIQSPPSTNMRRDPSSGNLYPRGEPQEHQQVFTYDGVKPGDVIMAG
ncbi:TNFAIP3-interacting protein 1-like isoform X2 [Dreissena polymorpha]|uniref:TNFAIP3-interacting protein 1-like isoform X2 n=1 Tax=Dreissena polymorpha TaxID=45954 RepID=UPI00226413C4|nr:TNFAIP3-interacting protein 1-like isoform X2 [Dreissena polymorpha]